MQNNDLERFSYCMGALGEAFSQEPSPLKTEIYFKALSDLPIDVIEKSVWQVIRSRTTASFPKVAELREAMGGKEEDKAILAYDAFTKGKAQTGAYESVVFEDKLIHAVIQSMGGWYEVCMITEDEWKFKRREFIDLYRAISRSPGREIPERLIGLGEAGCSQNPDWMRHTPLPRMINHHGEVLEYKQIAHDKQGVIE